MSQLDLQNFLGGFKIKLVDFSSDIIEKMERLCDMLSAIQKSEIISNRLSLYGGTALNFLYLDTPRLSEDLDFNYRHIDKDDWGSVRDELDHNLKWIIRSLGYKEDDIKINSHYNHCRFHLNYISEAGIKDNLKIEIGYMRRIPNLHEDCYRTFHHLIKETEISVKTPIKEELFANKFATMVSRSRTYLNVRDLFDVYSISKVKYDHDLFLELVVLETILMNISCSDLLNFKEHLKKGKTSGRIEHLVIEEFVLEDIILELIDFSDRILEGIQTYQLDEIIKRFYSNGELDFELFKFKDKLHPEILKHPQLLWLRKKHQHPA